MERTNGAGHLNHRFAAEDLATNRPPTELTAEWFNSVQEEIAYVIEQQSIALNANDTTQLAKAIAEMISGPRFKQTLFINANVTLTTTAFKNYYFFNSDGFTATLPSPTLTTDIGKTISFTSLVATGSIVSTGAANIYALGGVKAAGTPVILRAYESLVLVWDGTNWQQVSANSSKDLVGTIGMGFRASPPPDCLVCPTAQTNLSRTTYADLNAQMALLGYPFGAGDGATTFGMPWLLLDYTFLQGNGSNVGSMFIGQMPAHAHLANSIGLVSGNINFSGTGGAPYRNVNDTQTGVAGSGTENKAAGIRMLVWVKYR